jgi:hypothetical protein
MRNSEPGTGETVGDQAPLKAEVNDELDLVPILALEHFSYCP